MAVRNIRPDFYFLEEVEAKRQRQLETISIQTGDIADVYKLMLSTYMIRGFTREEAMQLLLENIKKA